MARKKRTPEEEAAFRRQLAEWDAERRDFAELAARFFARVAAERERRARRRALVRRLIPFR
jgi:hypothetical protein